MRPQQPPPGWRPSPGGPFQGGPPPPGGAPGPYPQQAQQQPGQGGPPSTMPSRPGQPGPATGPSHYPPGVGSQPTRPGMPGQPQLQGPGRGQAGPPGAYSRPPGPFGPPPGVRPTGPPGVGPPSRPPSPGLRPMGMPPGIGGPPPMPGGMPGPAGPFSRPGGPPGPQFARPLSPPATGSQPPASMVAAPTSIAGPGPRSTQPPGPFSSSAPPNLSQPGQTPVPSLPLPAQQTPNFLSNPPAPPGPSSTSPFQQGPGGPPQPPPYGAPPPSQQYGAPGPSKHAFGVGSPFAGPQAPPPSQQMSSLSLSGGIVGGGGFAQPPPLAPSSFGAPPPPIGVPLAPPPTGPGGATPAVPAWQNAASQRRAYPAMPAGGLVPPPPPIGGPPLPPAPAQQGLPGSAQPGGPPYTGQPSGGGSRIDPNQIPRPQAPASAMVFETRVNGTANLPPSATSAFVVRDTGNCSPKLMRASVNQVPCSGDLLATSGMPFVLMIQPLALQDPAEEPIQVVDFGESGPVRCSRCKAYINPFMRFTDQGRKFSCNICGVVNDTPHEYVCNLGPDGRRRDADERPELCRGAVEFEAPKEYMVRDPMPPIFYFLVDVSLNSVSTGATAAACSAIKKVLSDLPGGERTKVAIATFNSTIHFYNLSPSLNQPSMLVVPDVTDVYTPLPSDLIVSLPEAKERMEQLLESIPTMFADTRISDSCFGAAIQGAYLAMKKTGGKVVVFQSVLPSVGIGSLASREAEGRAASINEKDQQKLLQPVDKTLKAMAAEFADNQVAVDLFLTTQSFVDVTSLSVLPRITGGRLSFYYPFNAALDSGKLFNDLRWSVCRPMAMEGIMKVRCSAGLSVADYFGNFHRRIPAEIYLPTMDSDQAIMTTLKYEDKLQETSEACFQCALLYTTTAGQRRIRVLTLSLPTTPSLANVFRGADLDVQFSYFLKHAAMEVQGHSIQTVREAIISSCVNILFAYRKFCASASSSGQLILPEALKLLPLYALALTKSLGFRVDVKIDERSHWLAKVRSLPVNLSVPLVYPRMFALHSLFSSLGEEIIRENGIDGSEEILPPVLALSSEKLEGEGMFLVENGEDAFIWLGKGVPEDLVFDVLGARSVDEVVPGLFLLQEFENKRSRRVNRVVNEIRRQRCSYLRLRLVKRGDPSENLFFQTLVEDRTPSGMSYVEFLVYVHRQIQSKMG